MKFEILAATAFLIGSTVAAPVAHDVQTVSAPLESMLGSNQDKGSLVPQSLNDRRDGQLIPDLVSDVGLSNDKQSPLGKLLGLLKKQAGKKEKREDEYDLDWLIKQMLTKDVVNAILNDREVSRHLAKNPQLVGILIKGLGLDKAKRESAIGSAEAGL